MLIAGSDLNVFDPGKQEVVQFFVSLYELLEMVDARTCLIWAVVDLLQEASKNPSARSALAHTFQFTPLLTRVLAAQTQSDKKLKILLLLQVCIFHFLGIL